METLTTSSSSFSIFSPLKSVSSSKRFHLTLASKGDENGSNPEEIKNLPALTNRHMSLSPLSKDAVMGLVMGAATGRGWTTGSGMEGPPTPVGIKSQSTTENVSTFPWSLFTKSPRRRMLVAFTCNICGQRTTRAINPHAFTDGTVFVQDLERLVYPNEELVIPRVKGENNLSINQGVKFLFFYGDLFFSVFARHPNRDVCHLNLSRSVSRVKC